MSDDYQGCWEAGRARINTVAQRRARRIQKSRDFSRHLLSDGLTRLSDTAFG